MGEVIDFHMHTLASDGELTHAELVRRAFVSGYKVMGIADHLDTGNFNLVVESVLAFTEQSQKYYSGITIIPGVEITHVMPDEIETLTKRARKAGIKLVVVHGQTCVEPVAKGTNMAAIKSCVDILAHPGFITEEEACLAKENDVYLELTIRGGHSLTNAYVAKTAMNAGAKLVVDSDFHKIGNFLTESNIKDVIFGSGLGESEYKQILQNSVDLSDKCLGRR